MIHGSYYRLETSSHNPALDFLSLSHKCRLLFQLHGELRISPDKRHERLFQMEVYLSLGNDLHQEAFKLATLRDLSG